jgi:hypothetical protein
MGFMIQTDRTRRDCPTRFRGLLTFGNDIVIILDMQYASELIHGASYADKARADLGLFLTWK